MKRLVGMVLLSAAGIVAGTQIAAMMVGRAQNGVGAGVALVICLLLVLGTIMCWPSRKAI